MARFLRGTCHKPTSDNTPTPVLEVDVTLEALGTVARAGYDLAPHRRTWPRRAESGIAYLLLFSSSLPRDNIHPNFGDRRHTVPAFDVRGSRQSRTTGWHAFFGRDDPSSVDGRLSHQSTKRDGFILACLRTRVSSCSSVTFGRVSLGLWRLGGAHEEDRKGYGVSHILRARFSRYSPVATSSTCSLCRCFCFGVGDRVLPE